jgi:hypothetical protein
LTITQDSSDKKLAHLVLNTGLVVNNYSYKITTVVHKEGYDDKTVENTINFVVGKSTYDNFNILAPDKFMEIDYSSTS